MFRSRRIVLATTRSLGDLHPFLSVGLELKSRGHRPVLAGWQKFQAAVESGWLGLPPYVPQPGGNGENGAQLYRQTLDPYMGIVMAHERLVYPYLQDNYEELRSACEGADLLVSNNWLPIAPIVAEKAGLKWLAVFLQPLGLHSRFDPPVLPILPLQARFGPKARWVSALTLGLAKRRSAEFTRPLEQFRERLGLPPSKGHLVFETYSPYGNMGWFSRVIGSWRPDWPRRTKITGFVDAPGGTMADDPGLEAFLRTGSAPVVFALGSFAVLNPENFFAESAAIARTAPSLRRNRNSIISEPSSNWKLIQSHPL